jgi:hypothetical protein
VHGRLERAEACRKELARSDVLGLGVEVGGFFIVASHDGRFSSGGWGVKSKGEKRAEADDDEEEEDEKQRVGEGGDL